MSVSGPALAPLLKLPPRRSAAGSPALAAPLKHCGHAGRTDGKHESAGRCSVLRHRATVRGVHWADATWRVIKIAFFFSVAAVVFYSPEFERFSVTRRGHAGTLDHSPFGFWNTWDLAQACIVERRKRQATDDPTSYDHRA